MTEAEVILWQHVRARRLSGYKFRRQAVIELLFIADFYCHEKRLIVEVDGSVHLEKSVQETDIARTRLLNARDYHVVRFTNYQVINHITEVKSDLLKVLSSL